LGDAIDVAVWGTEVHPSDVVLALPVDRSRDDGHARRPKFLCSGRDVVNQEFHHRARGEVLVLRGSENLDLAPIGQLEHPDAVAAVAEPQSQDPLDSRSTLSADAGREVTMVPVEVKGVRLERAEPTEPTEPVVLTPQDRTYVMLRSPERSRALDIQIGSAEAIAISSALEGNRWDRPMTHDLLGEVIAALGATLRQVVITEHREDDVYIAEIEVTNQDGNAIRISARPSDAVALAMRLDAPILVNEALFADAA
jgi:bifunctional DNase/RNase